MARKLIGISIKDKVKGGKPCIFGTRFTVAQLLAELAEGHSVEEIAEDFDISEKRCRAALEQLAKLFDQTPEDIETGR